MPRVISAELISPASFAESGVTAAVCGALTGPANRRTECECRTVDPGRPGAEAAGFDGAALTFVLEADHVRSHADRHQQRGDGGKLAVPFGHLLGVPARCLIGSTSIAGSR